MMPVVKEMTCSPVMNDEMFRMECCLGRCKDCPTFTIPEVLMRKGEDAERIAFITHEYHSFCKVHKSLPGAPSSCPHCDDEAFNRKLFHRKKHNTQHNESMGTVRNNSYRKRPIFDTTLSTSCCLESTTLSRIDSLHSPI